MKSKKRIAAEIMKTSPKKVRFASDALEDIKKAITRSDIRGIIAMGKIFSNGKNEQSKVRARRNAQQKSKGRSKGKGTKKGKKNSVVSKKTKWIRKVRVQRKFLQELKNKNLINSKNYQMLYRKVKGGFFRNQRHIKLYINEYHLIENKNKEQQ